MTGRPHEPPEPRTAATSEAERIRRVYAQRDRRGPRHPAIAEAYRRLNRERLGRMHAILRTVAPPPAGRLLDVGCGGGYDLTRWLEAGWPADRIAGTDVVERRAAAARGACPAVDIRVGDGEALPFPAAAFDAATAVTVFSSILEPSLRARLFAEIERVVRPGGTILVYDFVVAKPTNRATVGMTLARLAELAGRPPEQSQRLSPLLHLVAAGSAIHPAAAGLAMRLAPRTHRLSQWSVPLPAASSR